MKTKFIRKVGPFWLTFTLILPSGLTVESQTNLWTNQISGKWEAATNWSLHLPPANSQSLFITNAGADQTLDSGASAKEVTVDAVTSGSFPSTMTISNLTMSGASSNVVNWLALTDALTNSTLQVMSQVTLAIGSQLTVTNSRLQVNGQISVGAPPPSNFTGPYQALLSVSSGSAQAGSVFLGPVPGSFGMLNVLGGIVTVSQRLAIGSPGGGFGQAAVFNNGALIATNTSHTASADIAANSELLLSGGLLQVDELILTNGGLLEDFAGEILFTNRYQVENGTMVDLNGASISASTDFILGAFTASLGTLTVEDGGELEVTNGVLGIGNNGTVTNGVGVGTVTVNNGTLNVATLTLGSSSGGVGNLQAGYATINVLSNVTLVSGSLTATSSISLTGGSFVATNGPIRVGSIGHGVLSISGGNLAASQILLGGSGSSTSGSFELFQGTVQVQGTGTNAGDGFVANSADFCGDLDGSGTTITIGDNDHSAQAAMHCGFAQFFAMFDGFQPGYAGTYIQDGGTMVISSVLDVGNGCAAEPHGASGTVVLSGGALIVTNPTHTAVLNINNGSVSLGSGALLVVDNLALTGPCASFVNSGGVLLPGNAFYTLTNLLLNPGAEDGYFDDWTSTGNVQVEYSYTPHSGSYDFTEGNDPSAMNGTMTQMASLVGNQGITEAAIDSGQLLATVSFWEQTLTNEFGLGPDDGAQVMLSFLDADTNEISSTNTPIVNSPIPDSSTNWSNYTGQYSIPAGTRFISYTVNFNTYSNDTINLDDNLLLVHSSAELTPLPSLTLLTAGTNVVVAWSTSATNFVLQSSTNLAAPGSWNNVTNVPRATLGGLGVTNSMPGRDRFYRLRGQ